MAYTLMKVRIVVSFFSRLCVLVLAASSYALEREEEKGEGIVDRYLQCCLSLSFSLLDLINISIL